MSLALLWSVTSLLFALGLAGVFVPVLPGAGLVFAGILFYAVATGFSSLSPLSVSVFGLLALIAWLADWAGAALGARFGGGKALTLLGMIGGAVLGIFLAGPAGFIVGGILGALFGALYEGLSLPAASKAALYSFFGIVAARLFQFTVSVAMIVAFLVIVL